MAATQTSFTSESPNSLIEGGAIALTPACAVVAHVHRGMTMCTREGTVAGHVAALMVDGQGEEVTHLVLSRPCQLPEYRLVPIRLIRAVVEEEIFLSFSPSILDSLPRWHNA